ncbi:MAG: tRNA pseudouridine(13) synthase TruD, partial [Pseudomonadota bacterium]
VSEHATLAAGLASEGLRQERRALRLLPQDLTANWLDTTTLELRFGLPAGSYATVLLRELIDYQDATRGDRAPVSAEN